MTIFRGPGGGGNATTDAEINALAAIALETEASALAASNAATAAAGSASTASTQASNASASASTASTQASNASTSASGASASAGTASTQAANASTSASNAAASAASVVRDGSGGIAGLTLFKINMRNVLNTFTSFLTNSNTAARTYTLPDKDGIVSMLSDLPLITSLTSLTSINGGQIAGMRNVILNGDMRIDQRNTGAALAVNNTGRFGVDRWLSTAVGTGASATVQRVGDAPDGFGYSLSYTNGTGRALASTDEYYIYQPVEFDNVRHFAYGSSAPKTVTLSFYVKSSVAGVYSGFVRSSVGAGYRSYVYEYTVNVANTWELKKIVVPGDSVAISAASNATGIGVLFDMGSGSTTVGVLGWQSGNVYRTSGSVNISATTGAVFKVTGVQLELSTTATTFEQRSYGLELALCQRYYQTGSLSMRFYATGGGQLHDANYAPIVTMRATPTVVVETGAVGNLSAFFVQGITSAGAFRGSVAAAGVGDTYKLEAAVTRASEL